MKRSSPSILAVFSGSALVVAAMAVLFRKAISSQRETLPFPLSSPFQIDLTLQRVVIAPQFPSVL